MFLSSSLGSLLGWGVELPKGHRSVSFIYGLATLMHSDFCPIGLCDEAQVE